MKILLLFVFVCCGYLYCNAQFEKQKDSISITKTLRAGELYKTKVSQVYFNVYRKDSSKGCEKLNYLLRLGKKYRFYFWNKGKEEHFLYLRRGTHKIIIKAPGNLPKAFKLKADSHYDYIVNIFVASGPPLH
jgi:hypothetical protein